MFRQSYSPICELDWRDEPSTYLENRYRDLQSKYNSFSRKAPLHELMTFNLHEYQVYKFIQQNRTLIDRFVLYAKERCGAIYDIPENPDPQITDSPRKIFREINLYRKNHGKSSLAWDADLAAWAQMRAADLAKAGHQDVHAGFERESAQRESELHFVHTREISLDGRSVGYGMSTTAIEDIDEEDVTHVGVGIAREPGSDYYSVDIIFGYQKN